MKRVITAADIAALAPGTTLQADDAIITPMARDEAAARGITLTAAKRDSVPYPPQTAKRLVMANDSDGLALKAGLLGWLAGEGYSVRDLGVHAAVATGSGEQAIAAAEAVSRGQAERGIIIDAAGMGAAMVANKLPGVRAAMCHDPAAARLSRELYDANVLVLASRWLTAETAREVVIIWLTTPFSGERNRQILERIVGLENRYLRR